MLPLNLQIKRLIAKYGIPIKSSRFDLEGRPGFRTWVFVGSMGAFLTDDEWQGFLLSPLTEAQN